MVNMDDKLKKRIEELVREKVAIVPLKLEPKDVYANHICIRHKVGGNQTDKKLNTIVLGGKNYENKTFPI